MRINWKEITIKDLAGLICEELRKYDIDVTLVGGACVSIYTRNRYLSGDLDFVTYSRIKDVEPILIKLGFERKSSRHFEHEECKFFIEFVAPPLSIGNQPVKRKNYIKSRLGTIALLTPNDCVKDRLAAYFYWNDKQSLEQALMVAKSEKINMADIRRWAKNENNLEKYKEFSKSLK